MREGDVEADMRWEMQPGPSTPGHDSDDDNTEAAARSPRPSSSHSGERLCYICLDDNSQKRFLSTLPCICAGSCAWVHEDCFKTDIALNRRTACSICHTDYQFEDRVTYFSFGTRMRGAWSAQPVWLTTVTLCCSMVAGVAFFMFSAFLDKFFGMRVPFGEDTMLLIGGVALCLMLAAWRYSYNLQPTSKSNRVLLSMPDKDTAVRTVVTTVDLPRRNRPRAVPVRFVDASTGQPHTVVVLSSNGRLRTAVRISSGVRRDSSGRAFLAPLPAAGAGADPTHEEAAAAPAAAAAADGRGGGGERARNEERGGV